MVKAKTVKASRVSKSLRRKSNYRKKNKRSVKKNNKRKIKTKQSGGNRVMIEKLCISSNKGKSIEEKDKVSSGYLKELCNENDNSQTGGSGIVSKIFKAATLPISIASGTFEKISGINLKEIVSNNVNNLLNTNKSTNTSESNASVNSSKKSGDRETDKELHNFLSKRNL